VIYGGPSVEHDVSVITAVQAMDALSERHTVVPLYVGRTARWYCDEQLRDRASGEPEVTEVSPDLTGGVVRPRSGRGWSIGRRRSDPAFDVALPAGHGTFMEDGALQGLLEACGVAYAGSGVAASALAMDKAASKAVLQRAGLPVVPSTEIRREAWRAGARDVVASALRAHPPPVYVKPLALGSSIGVRRCTSEDEVADALELVFELDRVAVVEASVEDAVEVNCAALGQPGGDVQASVCEQPVRHDALLSFDDKYLRGAKRAGMKGAERIIPAPLDDAVTARIQELTRTAFSALGCAGVARVDFLLDPRGTIYVNELNTIPGSFAFYLWEPAGVPFPDLLDRLLEIALAEHRTARSTTRTFESNLLSHRATSGAKG
jgi:D-alanine-D-alanine ligase